MEKIIEIDISEENDLLEKFNHKKASKELINYIIDEAYVVNKKAKIKILVNNKLKGIDSSTVIKEGLKLEYDKCSKKHLQDNFLEIIYLVLGIVILFLWTFIRDEVFSEVVLIGAWVLIWATVELEIFADASSRKKKRIIKRLLNSEIIEK